MNLATVPPNKEKLGWCIEDLHTACKKLEVDIRTGFTATVQNVLEFKPYAIIFATGSTPIVPQSIEGIDLDFVHTSHDILDKKVELDNKTVAVIGSGMTGLETAEFLAQTGNKISIVEMADEIGKGMWMQHLDDILPKLEADGVASSD